MIGICSSCRGKQIVWQNIAGRSFKVAFNLVSVGPAKNYNVPLRMAYGLGSVFASGGGMPGGWCGLQQLHVLRVALGV